MTKLWALSCAALMVLAAAPAGADGVADFYRGRNMTLIVGSAEGGSFDFFGRAAAAVMKRYIPGNPTLIVQNMPGASFVRATEYLYNVAPKDGTVILVAQPYIVLNKLLNPSAKYVSEDFVWLGRIAPLAQVGFVTPEAGITTVAEAKQREILVGSAGGTGPGALVPALLDHLIGTRFKVVRGYDSDSGLYIAVERGEIPGMGSTSYSELKTRGWVVSGKARVLYTIALQRLADLPDVPTIPELAPPGREHDLLELFTSIPVMGYTIFAPPGIPEDRADALRTAFAAMLKDGEFIAASKKMHTDIDPLSAKDVQALVAHTAKAPRDMADALREAVKPMD